MGGGGFEAFGEAMMVIGNQRSLVCCLGVVGPSYSVVRRDRGHCFELAVIASFYGPDGCSLFIQEIAAPQHRRINDPNDGLTLTLLARDGNRYRFPPHIFSFPKPVFTLTPHAEAALKMSVQFLTGDSLRQTWHKHKRESILMNARPPTLTQHITQNRNQLEAQRQQQQRARHQAAQRQFVDHHLVNPMQNMNLG